MSERTRWDAIVSGDIKIPVNDELGFKIEDTNERGAIALSWEVPAGLCNSAGNLQGGVLAVFADSLLGGAAATALTPDLYPALAEMKISIFRPAAAGTRIAGVGRVVKGGSRVLFVEAEVSDADGTLIAKASGTEVPAPL